MTEKNIEKELTHFKNQNKPFAVVVNYKKKQYI